MPCYFRNWCFVNTSPPSAQWYLMSRYDNFWNNYFLYILSPTINLLFWLQQLNFRKAVFDCSFSFSPSTSILKHCEVGETIYESSLHLTVEYIRERQCDIYPLLSAIQTQSHLPAPSQTPPIYCAQVPLSPKGKKTHHHCKAEKIIFVSLRLKSMLYVFMSIDPQRCTGFFYQLYENLNGSITKDTRESSNFWYVNVYFFFKSCLWKDVSSCQQTADNYYPHVGKNYNSIRRHNH